MEATMDERPCLTCTYARRPTGRLLRLALYRFPGLLICFHCAESDGQMTGVSPGGTCRNYRLRRKTPPATEPVDKAAGRKMLAPTPQEQEWRITLADGLTTLVDREDFETLARHKWSPSRIGRKIYVMRHDEKGRTVYMHRQITKARKGSIVDHANGDSLDNRRINLRVCTSRQNQANKGSRRGSSRFVGVHRHGDKWQAGITCRGKHYYLGLFDDEVEAAKARDRKAYELHGQFAYLNFPEDYGM